ncbi:MAG: hypothetical protein ACYDCK_12110, partial [Thermoplasmatota archaeon]
TQVLRLRFRTLVKAPIGIAHKIELFVAASSYVVGGLFVAAGILLGAEAFLRLPAPPSYVVPLALLAPLVVALAHGWTAYLAQRRTGGGDIGLILPYHIVSLAFTPVLFGSTLAALVSELPRFEGRVSKNEAEAARSGAGAFGAVAGLSAIFGVGLAFASAALYPVGGGAWAWALELACAFILPLLLWVRRPRLAGWAP